MNKIILNADDLGMNSSVNTAIMELIQKGILKSTTIMVKRNPVALEEAILIAGKFSGKVGFGIHLDLDDYFPFDETGHYGIDESDVVSNYREILSDNETKIESDIRSQIGALQKRGIKLSHLDGHHNVQLFPELLELLIPILRENGIDKVRFNGDFYKSKEKLTYCLALLKNNKINCPDVLLDMGQLIRNPTVIETLSVPLGVAEIMTHVTVDEGVGWAHEQYLFLMEHPHLWHGLEMIDYGSL